MSFGYVPVVKQFSIVCSYCLQALTHDLCKFREAGPLRSMQSPIHIWGTPPFLQHSSGEIVFGAGGGKGFGLGMGSGRIFSIVFTVCRGTDVNEGGVRIYFNESK